MAGFGLVRRSPGLAGLLFAASGTRLVLALDALTFLVVIPLALRLPAAPRDTGIRSCPSFARDASDGLAFIWRTPSVLAIALGFWIVVLFSAPDDLILPFLATLTFRAGPVAVGVLLAAASAGLLAGLPFVRPAGRRLGVTGAWQAQPYCSARRGASQTPESRNRQRLPPGCRGQPPQILSIERLLSPGRLTPGCPIGHYAGESGPRCRLLRYPNRLPFQDLLSNDASNLRSGS